MEHTNKQDHITFRLEPELKRQFLKAIDADKDIENVSQFLRKIIREKVGDKNQ